MHIKKKTIMLLLFGTFLLSACKPNKDKTMQELWAEQESSALQEISNTEVSEIPEFNSEIETSEIQSNNSETETVIDTDIDADIETETDAETETETEKEEKILLTCLDYANMHTGPAENDPVVGVIQIGDKVIYTGENQYGWLKVDYNGVVGYTYDIHFKESVE